MHVVAAGHGYDVRVHPGTCRGIVEISSLHAIHLRHLLCFEICYMILIWCTGTGAGHFGLRNMTLVAFHATQCKGSATTVCILLR